jgi:hypothetical protein
MGEQLINPKNRDQLTRASIDFRFERELEDVRVIVDEPHEPFVISKYTLDKNRDDITKEGLEIFFDLMRASDENDPNMRWRHDCFNTNAEVWMPNQ